MIIPALDLIDGQVVRLQQGSYDAVTQYKVEPATQFATYHQAGAQWLHLVDLSGARNPDKRQLSVISQVLSTAPTSIQIGGGIRSEKDIDGLLSAGADRVVIGSVAVQAPEKVKGWLKAYGAESIVLAVDVKLNSVGDYAVAISGWQEASEVTLKDLLEDYHAAGLRHVLCTDIARDGMLSGANVSLYRQLCKQFPALAFQSSGGIGSLDDIVALKDTGVAGVIVGRALLEGRFMAKEAIDCWAQ